MSQNLMSQLVKYEGECCIYGYFAKRVDKTPRELADHLGVSCNSIRVWRRKISEGKVTCGYGASGKGECRFHCQNIAQNTP